MSHPKQLLSAYGLQPKQSLGQNFLYDDNLLAQIVEAADVDERDNVLEIGPGLGALTRHLVRAAARVVAVEVDDRFIPLLRAELADFENLTVVHGDILDQDPRTWFGSEPYKAVGNVPYYITGAILEHLLGAPHKPELLVVTVQKEVAARIVAEPGEMSLLSVSVQFYGEPDIVTGIKAGAFWPRPEVDSAVVRIRLHEQPHLPLEEEGAFFRIVKTGFSQKRKQLQKNLRALGYQRRDTVRLLREAGIDPRRRAQALSVEEWLRIYHDVNEMPPGT